jgi:phosphoesterase RecJ-like protein
VEQVLAFINRHDSFILTTHDPADADGLGAELVFAWVLKKRGKAFRILNASPVPALFQFLNSAGLIEQWNKEWLEELPEQTALLIVDTADEYTIGCMKDIVGRVSETLVFDHHEPKPLSTLTGFIDSRAGSTCELAVAFAAFAGAELDLYTATAAYAGIVYDTGFFAYSKTSLQTFRAAIKTLELGVNPYHVYQQIMENASVSALLLQQRVLSTLELRAQGRVAVQVLRKEDLEASGAHFEDAESFINIPLRAREVAVSILVKETLEGKVRCSLRSKGTVNVSKIAQDFGGGGHVSAAGFRSDIGINETVREILAKVESHLVRLRSSAVDSAIS